MREQRNQQKLVDSAPAHDVAAESKLPAVASIDGLHPVLATRRFLEMSPTKLQELSYHCERFLSAKGRTERRFCVALAPERNRLILSFERVDEFIPERSMFRGDPTRLAARMFELLTDPDRHSSKPWDDKVAARRLADARKTLLEEALPLGLCFGMFNSGGKVEASRGQNGSDVDLLIDGKLDRYSIKSLHAKSPILDTSSREFLKLAGTLASDRSANPLQLFLYIVDAPMTGVSNLMQALQKRGVKEERVTGASREMFRKLGIELEALPCQDPDRTGAVALLQRGPVNASLMAFLLNYWKTRGPEGFDPQSALTAARIDSVAVLHDLQELFQQRGVFERLPSNSPDEPLRLPRGVVL